MQMSRCSCSLLVFGILGAFAANASADLYVVRVGTGAAALSSASTAVFVEKFADDGGGSPSSTIQCRSKLQAATKR
jgi:hypothetical protein